jgi:hypothetical protein
MKAIIFFFTVMLTALSAAPVQSAAKPVSYFPEEKDLGYPLSISLNTTFEDPAKLSKIADGTLISDVGFSKYSGRTYAGNTASLVIEFFELLDARAAYSLLTLLRTSSLQNGPPGDTFANITGGLCFAQGRRFVRIRFQNLPEEIAKQTATFISKRIGSARENPPSLVSHLPKSGFDSAGLRYFPAISAYENYVKSKPAAYINPRYDMEIAQARYISDGHSGVLSLLKLPTPELAEEYFSEISLPSSAQWEGQSVYVKRVGPLVAFLEGNFDPTSSDRLLKSVKFGYSIRWVDKKGSAKVIWGIPFGVLGAVVNSLIFVAILSVLSILLGTLVAVVRFLKRAASEKRSPHQDAETDISPLRLR